MAEGDVHIYRSFKAELMKGTFDLVTDVIQCALVAAYTLDEDVHDAWADVSAKEITDASYTMQALTGKSVTGTGTGTGTAVKGKWDAGNVTYNSLTGTDPNYAILYDDSVTAAPIDALICAIELTTTTNGGNYTLSWNANGIIRIS
jgi:hypothetical protein